MAGHLLLVFLMYSFSAMKAHALLPPTLTVNPAMITETDSVTLNCQTPSFVSVSQCYFRIVRGRAAKAFSCEKSLTGTELLKMSSQSSPAEVKVTCFYLHLSQSPESGTSSIIIRTSLPPKLTVNPVLVNETDLVTLNCQTPQSVSVSQCYFYTLSGDTVKGVSCLKTLTGAQLLKMSNQSSPAEVKVMCFYTVKFGETDSPSPHSDTASITIHSLKPQMSLQHFHGDLVIFTCSLPGSANHDTRCNLYFGEARRPIVTAMSKKNTKTLQWFCQFSVQIDDFLRRLSSVQQKDASCDYSLGSEPDFLSPRSDGYSLIDIVERQSHRTQTMPTSTLTSALTVSSTRASTPNTPTKSSPPVCTLSITDSFISTFLTSVKPESGSSLGTPVTKDRTTPLEASSGKYKKWLWKLIAAVAGFGVTVGIILLVSAILCNKRAGSEEGIKQKTQTENDDTYLLYTALSEDPAACALKDMVYSTVQMH